MVSSDPGPYEASAEQVVNAVRDRLELGPRRLSELVDELLAAGSVPDDLVVALGEDGGWEAVPQALAGLVDDALMDDPRVWPTAHDDPWLVLIEQFLDGDGKVLTHRLTDRERAEGTVAVVPDLVTLDMDASDGLDVPGAGGLWVGPGPGPRRPGHDDSVVEGPPGWLDAFDPGDLLVFRRRGLSVEVTRIAEPAPDGDVVDHLADAAHQRLRDDRGEEAYPLVLDAMSTNPRAFREPARPLGELLEAAGLERRGFSWGLRDRPWRDALDNARLTVRALAARRYGFDRCCLAAYDRIIEAIDEPEPAALTGRRLGRDLHHGEVGLAVVEQVRRFPDGTATEAPDTHRLERLAEIAHHVAAGARPESAAGHLVLALLADLRGEAELASSLADTALTDDPDHIPAARQAVLHHVDRGDLRAAVALLDRTGAGLPDDGEAYLRRLTRQITSPYHGTGRNQPCPCGSGRKFKACCQGRPQRTPRLLGALLDLRLHLFVHDEPDDDALRTTLALVLRDPDDDPDGEPSPLLADLAAFEGGLARRYLDRRGGLLPADEREILEAALDEPRRLWDVVDTDTGSAAVIVQDTDSGRKARVDDPVASQAAPPGNAVLWRIARVGEVDYPVGFPIEVEPDEQPGLRELLDDGPTTYDLANWYRALPS